MTRLLTGQHALGADLDRITAAEFGFIPLTLLRTLTATGLASSEAFGASTAFKQKTLTASALPSSEAFGSSTRVFPKGAQGSHPSTTDTRTTVTGPEDLSGKNFTQPVLITGSGITGSGVSFAKKPTFQDCSAVLSDVWFDQNTTANLFDVIGATSTTNVTIRRFTANAFKGDAVTTDGTHVGTVNLFNGLIRPAAADAGSSKVLTAAGLGSSEAFGTSTVTTKTTLVATSIPSSEALGGAGVLIGTTGSPGPVVPFAVTDIGDQIYGTWAPGAGNQSTDPRDGPETWVGEQRWRAQRWVDLYLDKAQFGRTDKTAPSVTYAGEVVVNSAGAVTGPSTGFTLTGTTIKTLTFDLRCHAIRVNGDPAHPENLIIAGKLWAVDPNAVNLPDIDSFNQTYDSVVGDNALLEFHDCTVALQNAYTFGGSDIPACRFDNTLYLDTDTPSIDGGFFEAFAHDGVKFGSGAQVWLRHCSWSPHVYIAPYTDPVVVGGLPLVNAGAPPTYSPTTTYAQWETVKVQRSGAVSDRYYSLHAGNVGNATPPSGLGQHNAHWQYYGNLHADLNQNGVALNDDGVMTWENCFWYQGQHTSIFNQHVYDNNTGKLLGSPPSVSWSAATNYPGNPSPTGGNKTSAVRASNGQEFVALATSGPASVGAKDPLSNPAYWRPGSAHAQTAQYCIAHGNSVSLSNKCLDPSNGMLDSVFSLDFQLTPVQANGGGDNADGVHVINKRNRLADSAHSNPFLTGSTTN